jgi:cell division protein FtsB
MPGHNESEVSSDPFDHEVLRTELSKLKARVAALTNRIDALEDEAQSGAEAESTQGRK